MAKHQPPTKPEIVIGLVGAVGTDLGGVGSALAGALEKCGYYAEHIRLTDQLRARDPKLPPRDSVPRDKYIRAYIRAADRFCDALNNAAAMGLLGLVSIRQARRRLAGRKRTPPARPTAYIVSSFKRPKEVELFRDVYGPNFFLVAAYSPRNTRVTSLADDIARDRNVGQRELFRSRAESLVVKDERESADVTPHGQNVRATFPIADVFINAADPSSMLAEVERFVSLLFGHPFITPTKDEYAMFLATGVSRRSSDLGRQVGCCIVNDSASVVATGTNEVPAFGGGAYWPGQKFDSRDFTKGKDISFDRRSLLLADVLSRLQKEGWLSEDKAQKPVKSLVADALGGLAPFLRDSQVMDVIEFGRAVHAEMLAITDAASRGVSVNGCILMSTTFPCHNCARHIVSAGLRRVVYIEPYPKSLAGQLFPDSITIDPEVPDEGSRVRFEPFVGIGPSRYLQLFAAPIRKNDHDGTVVTWVPAETEPRVPKGLGFYSNELAAISNFDLALRRAKMPRIRKGGRQ